MSWHQGNHLNHKSVLRHSKLCHSIRLLKLPTSGRRKRREPFARFGDKSLNRAAHREKLLHPVHRALESHATTVSVIKTIGDNMSYANDPNLEPTRGQQNGRVKERPFHMISVPTPSPVWAHLRVQCFQSGLSWKDYLVECFVRGSGYVAPPLEPVADQQD